MYHIEFAKTGTGLSGGETWMVEVIKYLRTKGLHNVLLTTDNGKETYENLGLKPDKTLSYKVINSYKSEQKYPVIISYLLRTVQAYQLVKRLKLNKNDVIFCHSDFFPNTIPFYFLARRNKSAQLFCLFHMLAPTPWKGFEGHFTGRWQLPKFNVIHYKLNQWLYFRIIPKRATVLTNNQHYADILHTKLPENNTYVFKKFAGADVYKTDDTKKVYDVLWLGRFHPQKGLLEIPAIIELVKRRLGGVKVAIVGGGNDTLKRQLLEEVDKKGLQKNIEMKGTIMGREKYRYINESQVFLMCSFYESFGIVILEALKNRVPVVAYDLPVYEVFTSGVIKVPILDKEAAAEAIIKLLTDPQFYKNASRKAHELGASFSWQKTGEEIYNLLRIKTKGMPS